LRDATSTVENIGPDLRFIMSKKLAEASTLSFSMSSGLRRLHEARRRSCQSAEVMIETGKRMGKQVVAHHRIWTSRSAAPQATPTKSRVQLKS